VTHLKNIHPIFERVVSRGEKELRNRQRARVIWLFGLSGSGKSTLAVALEKRLFGEGHHTHVLDGDNVRTGLNSNLGFTDEDRAENIRRIAEVSKLMVEAGLVVINSFITPLQSNRDAARAILREDLLEVYVRCSFDACAARDVKGLYAKASQGGIGHFTGKDSGFEEPQRCDLILDTEKESPEQSLQRLYAFVIPHLRRSD
jgi:adenylylsulfate kinase